MRSALVTNMLTVMLVLATVSATASAQGARKGTTSKAASRAALEREARIPETDARKTALAEVPGGQVQSHELEREKGKLIYSYDIKVAGNPGIEEINVDATTGAVVAHEHEDAKTEAREKKAEAKEKRQKP